MLHSVIKRDVSDSGKNFMFKKLNEEFIKGVKAHLRNFTESSIGY